MTTASLSPRELAAARVIQELLDHDHSLSLRELAVELEVALGTAAAIVARLERKGIVRKLRARARSLELLCRVEPAPEFPVMLTALGLGALP